MTRLLHGFTILAGTCALTLIVGCGGSSTPKVKCDGGGCSDAKRDTSGTKYDGSVVTKYDGPVAQPDSPVAQPDGPVAQPDSPVAQPDGPVAQPDGPVARPDGPTVTPDAGDATDTTPSDDVVLTKFDVIPAQKFDVKNDTSGTPDVVFDAPAPLFDVAQDLAVDVVTDVLDDASEAGDATEAGEAG
jgi:hypothetical protein